VIALAFVHFAYREHYSYGAYKIVSVNIWMLGFLTIAGGIGLVALATPLLPRRMSMKAAVAAVVLLTVLDRTIVQAHLVRYQHNAFEQAKYRETLAISAIVADVPTLLSVRDDFANEWAVYYLSDPPLLIVPYRSYMAQAHVIPFMERAKAVDPTAIRFVVTDRNDAIRAALSGAWRVWDGQAYSLWKIDTTNWAVIADARNANGIETDGLWLGGTKTEFLTVTARSGPATFTAIVQPGPRAAPGTSQFHAMLEDASGRRQIVLQPGENRFVLDLASGRGSFALTIEDPASGPVPDNGDIRPLILHLTDYGIERGDKGQP
jgi:hypothetical protein